MDKNTLRDKVKSLVKNVDKVRESAVICKKLKKLLINHTSIVTFTPLKDEPDISPIFDERFSFILTITHINKHSAILIPGRAFDKSGNRLGRGGGYYDRILRDVKCLKIGVAFNCQLFDSIPVEPHDQKVDIIIHS